MNSLRSSCRSLLGFNLQHSNQSMRERDSLGSHNASLGQLGEPSGEEPTGLSFSHHRFWGSFWDTQCFPWSACGTFVPFEEGTGRPLIIVRFLAGKLRTPTERAIRVRVSYGDTFVLQPASRRSSDAVWSPQGIIGIVVSIRNTMAIKGSGT
jgi:hypothetical protein